MVRLAGLFFVISEYDPNVALTSVLPGRARRPQCDVYSDGWILGVTPGDTWTSFTAQVVENPE